MPRSEFERGVQYGIGFALDILTHDEALTGNSHEAIKIALRTMLSSGESPGATDLKSEGTHHGS